MREQLKDEDDAIFEQILKLVWRENRVAHYKEAGNGQAGFKYFAS